MRLKIKKTEIHDYLKSDFNLPEPIKSKTKNLQQPDKAAFYNWIYANRYEFLFIATKGEIVTKYNKYKYSNNVYRILKYLCTKTHFVGTDMVVYSVNELINKAILIDALPVLCTLRKLGGEKPVITGFKPNDYRIAGLKKILIAGDLKQGETFIAENYKGVLTLKDILISNPLKGGNYKKEYVLAQRNGIDLLLPYHTKVALYK